ncbi:hypothetical protein ACE14D_27710 [Streptomyces sp. Act-28]
MAETTVAAQSTNVPAPGSARENVRVGTHRTSGPSGRSVKSTVTP